jgi:hypothetical protein
VAVSSIVWYFKPIAFRGISLCEYPLLPKYCDIRESVVLVPCASFEHAQPTASNHPGKPSVVLADAGYLVRNRCEEKIQWCEFKKSI